MAKFKLGFLITNRSWGNYDFALLCLQDSEMPSAAICGVFFLPLIMRVSHLFLKPVAEISTCFRRQLEDNFFSLSPWVSIAKNSYRTELFCCVGVFAHVVSLKTD